MFYELEITKPSNENDEPIQLISGNTESETTGAINSVVFKVDTVPEHATKRSNELNVNLTIKGNINGEEGDDSTNEMCRRMLNWSISSTSDYRSVKLTMLSNRGNTDGIDRKVIREYRIERVFCVDYTETFGINGDDTCGEYTLELRQEGGKLDKVKAYNE